MQENFAKDVLEGLSASPKFLKSCYLWNPEGDRLFQEKMTASAYYLTNCEYAVFTDHKDEIINIFNDGVDLINFIELGAGDGLKTKILLEHHVSNHKNITYIPIDISENILAGLACSLTSVYPELKVKPIAGEYIEALTTLGNTEKTLRNVVVFIGSSIGNLVPSENQVFLQKIAACLKSGDIMLIGFDMKKSPQLIKEAYTVDPNEAFYKNILVRINEELQGNFDVNSFEHYFSYNPINGLGETFLLCKEKRTFTIPLLNTKIDFKAYESIHISYHQKYDEEYINGLAEGAGFEVIKNFYDKQKYFSNTVLRLK